MEIKKLIFKIIAWLLFIGLLSTAAYGAFFVWKINKIEKQIDVDRSSSSSLLETFKDLTSQEKPHLKGMEEDRINILLLGVAGEGKPGKFLTDTLILASINTRSNQIALMSIPRDLYVEVPEENFSTKINTVYQFGLQKYDDDKSKAISPIQKTVEEISSLPIHYWAVLDFEGFQKAIDAVGGINISNERDIYDPRYPGPNYSYETFELEKGLHLLDGKTALKYARMRHNDPEGDFGRAKRQQQVLQATKNKVFSSRTLLNVVALNGLFDALGENIRTNLDRGELSDLLLLMKKLDTENIINVVLDAWNPHSLLKVSHVYYGEIRSFVLIPRIGNWGEVQESSQNIFDTNVIIRKREEISAEKATVAIINESGNNEVAQKINKLLKDSFGYGNVFTLSSKKKNLAQKSIVYDLTEGQKPFTLDELVKKLPASASYGINEEYETALNKVEADILVVLGEDLARKYDMDEVTIEEYNESTDANEYREFRNNN